MALISDAKAQEFRDACQGALGFLTAYGFSDARLSNDAPIHSVVVRFIGRKLAVECIWDAREDALEVKVARLHEGKVPVEFAVDAAGRRVRDHLVSILVRHGVRGFGFRKVPPTAAAMVRWRSLLEDYAILIQQHGGPILTESANVLD